MFNSQDYGGNPANFEAWQEGGLVPLNEAKGFVKLANGQIVDAGQQQYNGRGELNAYDKADADARIAATAELRLARGKRAPGILRGGINRIRRSADMTPAQREKFGRICRIAASGPKENIHLVADVVSDTV